MRKNELCALMAALLITAIWGCALQLREPAVAAMAAGDAFSLEALTAAPSAAQTPAPVFRIERIHPSAQPQKKRVLIYHTHTYEAYEQDADAPYPETEKWRTADESRNVQRVGEALASLLEALGFEVVHDDGVYEPPNLSTSYARSLEMLERRQKDGETYDLYIDLHRDAYASAKPGDNTVKIGGEDVARLMLLIGKGEGYTQAGYEQRPQWNKNLAVAENITDALNEQARGLCKNVCIKSGRFNQHVADCCVLIEAGNNRNTLSSVLAAMPYLADAVADALSD
ncbi:MAG: stage II sporulation protein P [Eubacteriales bacterium]|nr:stage II sporulation protein P [Eubacteriales bacterium]